MPYFTSKSLPWAGEGITSITQYGSFQEAFDNSKLNYEVAQRPCHIYDLNNKPTKIPGMKVNVRTDTGVVLGVASNKYKLVQNREAFEESIEALRSQMPLEFTSCGVIHGGESAFMTLTSEPYEILDEEYRTAFIFSNSFNNRSGVKVTFAPYREICKNGLHVAIKGSTRFYNFRHTGDVKAKLDEILKAVHAYNAYLIAFREMLEKLDVIPVFFNDFLDKLYPNVKNVTPNQQAIDTTMRDRLRNAYNAPDLYQHQPTAWRALQACADVDSHFSIKNTKAVVENKVANIAIQNRPTLLQAAYDILTEW